MVQHAVIAGAGIGGLTAALTLADVGWTVQLLERTPVLGEVGAGVQLSPNAVRILDTLGVLPAVRRMATAPRATHIRRARDGRELVALPQGAEGERRWGAPTLVIHRADLQRILLQAVAMRPGIALTMGVEVAGFAAGADKVAVGGKRGLARVGFEASLLVGADGLRSFVRRQMVGPEGEAADAPVYASRTAWRALVPVAAAPEFARRAAANLWLGRRAHLVHYPLAAAVNVVAVIDQAAPPTGSGAGEWNVSGDPAALDARVSDWCDEARTLIAAAPEWRVWPLFERPVLARWSAGRVVLLGDAAHPMLPFLAQGAAQAIEDAAALASALATSRGDVATALGVYEQRRAARAARVQRESRRQGEIYHFGGPMAAARDLVMRTIGAQRLMARYDWLYGQPPG